MKLLTGVLSLLFSLTSFAQTTPPDRSHDMNYPADAPFYWGNFSETTASTPLPAQLKFVSYNIDFTSNLNAQIEDLKNIPSLKDADFVMLQEAVGNRDGTTNTVEAFARALKMNYVFAPGCVLFGVNYGNAILSRWPIGNFHKVLLPLSDADNQRIALGATARIGNREIMVYSLHLTVKFKDTIGSDTSRSLQVKAFTDEAEKNPNVPTFFSGDFNNVNPFGWKKVLQVVQNAHFTAVPDKGWTFKTHHFTLDHAFEHGFDVVANGIAYEATGSDHAPIWSILHLQ
jgi:endonuclease/exonuclease/phosphatase family metal-dependent hydrolase